MQEQGKIPFVSAVLMSINVIVGVGIYFGPQLMVQKAGTMSFLGWIAAGLLLFPVIWNIALAARMFPGAGGFYNYCTQGLGKVWGFVAVWAYLLGFLATAAMQITALRDTTALECGWPILISSALIFNLMFVGILSLLNGLEVGLISRIQSIATVLKIVPMLIVILGFWFYWNSSMKFSMPNFTDIGYTIPTAIFGYWGFESCCSISHLIKGGPSRASSVILTAFTIVALLYTSFHFGVTCIMGATSLELLGVTAFPAFMGVTSKAMLAAIKMGMSFIFILAFFNAAYGVMLANIANISSLASKKLLFGSKLLEKTNRYNRPLLPIILQCGVLWALMSFIPHKAILIALANFGVIIAMILTITAVFRVQLREKQILPIMITVASYASCAVLVFFSWSDLGSTSKMRLIALVPLVIGLVAGLIMYSINKKNA